MKEVNTKGLGKKQLWILWRMQDEKLLIRCCHDYRDMSHSFVLEDEESANSYENVTHEFVQSLVNRGLVEVKSWTPSLQMDIDEVRLAKSIIVFRSNEGQKQVFKILSSPVLADEGGVSNPYLLTGDELLRTEKARIDGRY